MNNDNTQQEIPSGNPAKNPVAESVESHLDFSVIGIGASAGGLEALQEFFKNTPDNPGVAFVIIQHLSPDYKSLMDELLARYTHMKIHRVKDGMEVKPNHIYLITPRKNMTIFHGKLFLTDQDHARGMNLPIDIFMRSLAEDQGKNAIGVILSGTGSDGTLGIRAIKENGGMVIVQDDRSAKFDGMPRSSISTGIVDYILTPGEMPEALINYIKHPFIQKTKNIENQISQEEDYLSKIIMIIRDVTGIDFTNYKQSTIVRRLEKRISINRYDNISDYVDFLSGNKREVNILYKDLLIGVTRFFRDSESFAALKEKVFPEIITNGNNKTPLRIWSIGCSTGEEAYSLAIQISEFMEEHDINREVKLFATDLDMDSIEFAGVGLYPENIISDISPERLKKYFTPKNEGYQVNERIRSMVVFASHNILKDPPFSKIDLISCRNMLIYLNNDVQQKILSMLYFALNKEAYLFLGSSESVGNLSNGFTTVDNKAKIYKYQPGYKPPVAEAFRIPAVSKKQRDLKNAGTYFSQSKTSIPKLDNIFDELLSEYVPPSVILDENYNIVHTIHNVSKFLTLPVGQVSLNILNMLPEKQGALVSSLLRKAKKKNQQVVYESIRFENMDKKPVTISGRRLDDKKTREIYFMVSFQVEEEREPLPDEKESEKVDLDDQYQERINELEQELQYTKESLQATVEELETSNEELQSSNEELIASNEELQSTNEELQSVNEELYTVNAEHQNKIDELTQLNADMNNLLKNTNIGTLFIDSKLHIRKLTDIASEITNIRDSDVGRPINHISLNHVYPGFIDDISTVLDNLQPNEAEIYGKDGKWYLIRIIPYRTAENAVDGVIITFIDISTLKKAEEAIKKSEEKYRSLFYSNRDAILVADKNRRITDANPALEKLFGYKLKEITGEKTSTLYSNEQDFEEMGKLLKGKEDQNGFIKLIAYKNKEGRAFYGETSTFQMKDTKGNIQANVGLIRDITDRLHAEKKLRIWEYTVNSINEAIILLSDDYRILQYNNAFLNLFNVNEKEIKEKKSYEIIHGTKKPPVRCVTCKGLSEKATVQNKFWEPNLKKHIKVTVDPVYDTEGNFEFAVEKIEVEPGENGKKD